MITIPLATLRDSVRGTTFIRRSGSRLEPIRLPEWTNAQHSDSAMARVSDQAAGVYLDLVTSASILELDALLVRTLPPDAPASFRPAVFEAVVDGKLAERIESTSGPVMRARTPDEVERTNDDPFITLAFHLGAARGATRRVQLWLPHTANVTLCELRADENVFAVEEDVSKRWIHYGSSISHCADADGPRGTWPTIAATRLGWQLTNLGFGGQAMLDQFVARTIRDLPADIITLKVGINPLNTDSLRARTFIPAVHGFLDTVRDQHPETPIVLISPIACPAHEQTPGPTVPGRDGSFTGTPDRGDRPGVLTLSLERTMLSELVARRADPALSYLDGRALFSAEDAEHLFDGLHPDAAGYRLMGERFARLFSATR